MPDRDLPSLWPRLLLALLIAAAVTAFYLTGLYRELSWDAVRGRIEGWQAAARDNLPVAMTVYFLVYVSVTGLSLPSSLALGLVAGALFGLWLGLAVVSVASTVGACLAFLSGRYLFRGWVRRRLGGRVGVIDRGIERDGAWFLLTMRLTPVIPYFLINIGMGLTTMPLGTFAFVSWLGMLPATLIIVNTGTAFGTIKQPSDALSPYVIVSLSLLGLMPLLMRWLVRLFLGGVKKQPPTPETPR